ncbi:S9 family peptidase [Tautonia plasticadhaerens]|uniref:Prolyl tripeptidyl peptidase n=1 Tax=Tautonia plasticadhaerens TaxID=2527974 RepID=A0A518H790_9BACT|nr:S9 family peptidase [Tautonia plasticadhaerens]QDV36739.1 Prolyl tripeptidyl peptidase precursor [Tautonia plasticadhaerens]
MTRLVPLLLIAALAFTGRLFAAGRPMTVDDLLAVKTVSDPQVSPDGTRVVYVVSEIDRESSKSNSDLWLVPVSGGEPKRLTTAKESDSHPRWSPDGSSIAFLSSRGGSAQVWLLPMDGGEARQLTTLPIDVDGPIWSPTGEHLAVVARVYPGMSPEETAKKDKEQAEAKTQVKAYDNLMVRHWSSWDDAKRSHPFVVDAKTGEARDLTPDLPVNVPPQPFGGSSDYSFSSDGKTLAFTAEPRKDHPWSTNTDIWLVSVEGGEPTNLTADNEGADAQPAFSPDSFALAYLSQARGGFEADQWVLKAMFDPGGVSPRDDSRGDIRPGSPRLPDPIPVTKRLDRPVNSFSWVGNWGGNGKRPFLAVIDDAGSVSIAEVGLKPITEGNIISWEGEARRIVTGHANGSPQMTPDGQTIVFTRSAAHKPAEIYRVPAEGGEPVQLTRHNDDLVAQLDLSPAESFTFSGADGDEVQGWLVRPPGFDRSKKYPVLFLIHGGPQGSWHDSWHARWNLGLFAAPGYAVVAINPRGSTGFGQEFTDQISTDWSGRVYEDLMKGLDHALATYPFLDAEKLAAAGGSYGGYMVNWIAGHSDRFSALISHAGVFDLHSMYFTTEELWFPEWEFGGPPWTSPENYQVHSPSNFVEHFETPTLVIHGALDFRVPDAQGLGMFTALQRRGVPSRYVFFPDEGHWIAKVENRVVWWDEVHSWLKRYLEP